MFPYIDSLYEVRIRIILRMNIGHIILLKIKQKVVNLK